MAGKKLKPYEYTKALKKQSPGIQAMVTTGEKAAAKRAAAAKKIADKKAAAKMKKKPLTLRQKTKKRLKKLFG